MRAPRIATLVSTICLGFAAPVVAQDNAPAKPQPPLAIEVPADTDECLQALESVIEHARDADLLDDQIDEAEAHLERFETACHDKRFAQAVEEAKAIVKIVSMNK